MEGQELFRKKSLEKISSPEQMNDYLRVTNPGVWLVLGAVIALLAGLIVWAAVGLLETTVATAVVAGPEGAVCYVREDDLNAVHAGQTVRVGGGEYKLEALPDQPVYVDDSFDAYALHVGGIEIGQWVYPTAVDAELTEGVYEALIVTDGVAPISFLLN